MEKVNCPGKWNCGGQSVRAVPLVISPFHTSIRSKTTSGHETEDSRNRLLCTESRHGAKKYPSDFSPKFSLLYFPKKGHLHGLRSPDHMCSFPF